MEEHKGNRKGLIFFLVFFIIISLGLGGYIAYDKCFAIKKDIIENANKPIPNTIEYNYNLSQRKIIQQIYKKYGSEILSVLIDTEGNAYLTLNLSNEEILSRLENIEKQSSIYSPKGYKSYDNDSTELKAYKLDISNVLAVYSITIENTYDDASSIPPNIVGSPYHDYFVFIREGGKLSYMDIGLILAPEKYAPEAIDNIELKDIDNVDNIVSIVENDFWCMPYAVGINGKEYLFSTNGDGILLCKDIE